MPTEIKYTTRFRKQYAKADKKVKTAFAYALEVFLENPDELSLRDHPLRGQYSGYRSIDVSSDWRAIYKEARTKDGITYFFTTLGTHEQLYGK